MNANKLVRRRRVGRLPHSLRLPSHLTHRDRARAAQRNSLSDSHRKRDSRRQRYGTLKYFTLITEQRALLRREIIIGASDQTALKPWLK